MKSWHGMAPLLLTGAALLFAQDWKTGNTLPGVDLNALSTPQKETALKAMRAQDCSCGCGMKVAQCRVEDPNCSYSKGMSQAIVDAVKSGKNEQEAEQAAASSRWGSTDRKMLDEPVQIPVGGSPATGPANAPITLVEFSDFQCPYCVAATPEIHELLKAYPTQVRLIFKEYPLETHPQAAFAAAAALAAQNQGKFWEMYQALFAARGHLSQNGIMDMAKGIGLDMKKFETDMNSVTVREAIMRDVQDGDKAGVEGTPTLFINGQRYNGAIQVSALKPVLDAALKPANTKLASR